MDDDEHGRGCAQLFLAPTNSASLAQLILLSLHTARKQPPGRQHHISKQLHAPNDKSTMPLHVRNATEADAPAMADVSTRAFRDSLSQILFPPRLRHLSQEDQETPWRAARTVRRMRDGMASIVVVDTADDGEETVVGMAQWVRPVDKDASAAPPPSAGGTVVAEDPAPVTLDGEALIGFLKQLGEETKKVLGPDGSKHMWCECSGDWSRTF